MSKVITMFLSLFLISSASAEGIAHLKIKVTNPIKQNKYFLCLYGVGCLSIRAGDDGKIFNIMPLDMANIQKIVVTDVSDMSMYFQPLPSSCQVKIQKNQTLTVLGHLVVKNNKPHIDSLHCSISNT